MFVIKVNATDSTNLHLKRLMAETRLEDYTVLVAYEQRKGKGQFGNKWVAEPGKNLTLSVLKYHEMQDATLGFSVSMTVSRALIGTLSELRIPDLSIKWPNDIMSGRKKICGILIENTIKGTGLNHSIIGIGMNVNQESFEGLPHAASLKQITGITYDLNDLLDRLMMKLKDEFMEMERLSAADFTQGYEDFLFLKDKSADYEIEGKPVTGIIRGVTPEGKLILEVAGRGRTTYDLKEIMYRF